MDTWLAVLVGLSPFLVGLVIGRWWALPLAVIAFALITLIALVSLSGESNNLGTDPAHPLTVAGLLFVLFVVFPASTATVGVTVGAVMRDALRTVWRRRRDLG